MKIEKTIKSSVSKTVLITVISLAAILLINTGNSLKPVNADTVDPNNTGISQGALVARSSSYQDAVLDATANSGAKWIRLDLYWPGVEPNAPVGGVHTYNWGDYDDLFLKAKNKGLEILVVVTQAPTWATDCTESVFCPPNKDHSDDWKAFLTQAAERYEEPEYGIDTYEIWNEPNLERNFKTGVDAAQYFTDVLKPAFEALTAEQPWVTVLTGGTSPADSNGANVPPWQFIIDLYAAETNADDYFHHVAHHPYTFPHAPTDGDAGWNAFLQMDRDEAGTTSIRTTMINNTDADKKIWATEIGYPTNPSGKTCSGDPNPCVSETVQKEMLALVYNEWAKRDYAGNIFWYAAINDPEGDPNDQYNRENHFGLKHDENLSYAKKPAYNSFSGIVSKQYVNTVLGENQLRHYWILDELSGSTAVNSIDPSANGTYTGSGVVLGSDGVMAGSSAVTFPETNSNRVEIANNDSYIHLWGNRWTIEFNARREGGSISWPGIMGRGDATTKNGWMIYNNHQNGDKLSFKRNNQECSTTSTVYSDGKAHHFAVTYNGSSVKWYVDGSLDTSCFVSYPKPSSTQDLLLLGASPDFPGNNTLGHVAIYNQELSASTIQAHSNNRVVLP